MTDISSLANRGAIDLQTMAGQCGFSLYTILREFQTGAGLSTAVVSTGHIATNAVTTAKVLASAITTAKMAASAVTTAKMAASAVTTAKVGAGAVTTAKIGASAVTTAKIGAGAVTNAKIAANTINLGSGTNLAYAGKLNAKYVTFTTGAANANKAVTVTLGRTPIGYIQVGANKTGNLYDGSVAHASDTLNVRSATATVIFNALVF